MYPLVVEEYALNCIEACGPVFGSYGLTIGNDYTQKENIEAVNFPFSAFHDSAAVEGELFGSAIFSVDEYEVYKLE